MRRERLFESPVIVSPGMARCGGERVTEQADCRKKLAPAGAVDGQVGLAQPGKTGPLLVIDDQPLYREALSDLLRQSFRLEPVLEVPSVPLAKRALKRHPDARLLFLNLNRPDAVGVASIQHLVTLFSPRRILVIAASLWPELERESYNAGVAGFVSKCSARKELERAVHAVLNGDRSFPHLRWEDKRLGANVKLLNRKASRLTERLKGVSNRATGQLNQEPARPPVLTAQQRRILDRISEGKFNKQIAFELNLAEATVKAHVTAIMQKLGVRNRTQAALMDRANRQSHG